MSPGDLIAGKLEVERVLGTGGCGVVVACRHRELGERVAVKLLQRSAMRSKETVERFAREARAAARLRSEHVARVNDFGTTETGIPYMVMECLDGEDLGATLARDGRVGLLDAVDYVLMACDAVAEAHALGIVHRDLKPANLFLTHRVDGREIVKVLDFGISKLLIPEGAEFQPSMTQTQAVLGSPLYMSPEQMEASRDVDARADIWALGTILYQLLAGAPPFEASTVPLLYVKVLSGERPAPLAARREGVAPELVAAIERCLMREPSDRFASVGHLAVALAPFASPDVATLAERIARVSGATGGSGAITPSTPLGAVIADDGSNGPTSGVRRVTPVPPPMTSPAAAPVVAPAPAPLPTPMGLARPRRARVLGPLLAVAVAGSIVGAAAAFASMSAPPAVPANRAAVRVAMASGLAFRAARADLALADATSMRDAAQQVQPAEPVATGTSTPAASGPATSAPDGPPRSTAAASLAPSSRGAPPRRGVPADPMDVLDER